MPHRKRAPFSADPLAAYSPMMSVKDVMEVAGIGRTAATSLVQRIGGMRITEGTCRSAWRISKAYVGMALNLPGYGGTKSPLTVAAVKGAGKKHPRG